MLQWPRQRCCPRLCWRGRTLRDVSEWARSVDEKALQPYLICCQRSRKRSPSQVSHFLWFVGVLFLDSFASVPNGQSNKKHNQFTELRAYLVNVCVLGFPAALWLCVTAHKFAIHVSYWAFHTKIQKHGLNRAALLDKLCIYLCYCAASWQASFFSDLNAKLALCWIANNHFVYGVPSKFSCRTGAE